MAAALAAACGGGGDAPDSGTSATAATSSTSAAAPVRGRTVWRPPSEAASDPVATARSFFEDFVGYEEPPGPLSPFHPAGDTAGTVEVPVAFESWTATTTIHLVLRDGAWEVAEVRTPEVSVAEPQAGATVDGGALRVSGDARSPDGSLDIEVKPLALGGGTIRLYLRTADVPTDTPGPFSERLPVHGRPGGIEVSVVVEVHPGPSGSPGPTAVTAVPIVLR